MHDLSYRAEMDICLQIIKNSEDPCDRAAFEIAEEILQAAGDTQRRHTAERFLIACEDLLSGRAQEMAKTMHQDPLDFAIKPHLISSDDIGRYILLRRRVEGYSMWPGPVAVTVRKNRAMMRYIEERRKAFARPRKPRRGARAARLEEVVDKIEDPVDQSIVREALAKGDVAKRQLDLALTAIARLGGVDYEDLHSLNLSTGGLPIPQKTLSLADRNIARALWARLSDQRFLDVYSLEFVDKLVCLTFSRSDILVFPEELSLLERLAHDGIEER